MDNEVIATTKEVCGRDANFRLPGSGELFAPPELRLVAAHVGLRGTEQLLSKGILLSNVYVGIIYRDKQ